MNVVIVVLLLHLLINYFFKPKGNILCCGLFGGSFNRPIDNAMKERIKILGLFNQNRGKDSCGYYDGQGIYKGVDKNKEFFDMVVANGLNTGDGKNNIFIGHTRQSTYGLSNAKNAHPFNIEDKLILAHNGTISNIWNLATKHGVKTTEIDVDSECLGHIMVKDGHKVLEEYIGAAALTMHRLKEPNVLYLYHGSSREYLSQAEVEERPLFWMKTTEGIYYSSLLNALQFIKKEEDEEPEQVPHNQIIKIQNGKVSKSKPIYIDRGECNIKFYPTVPTKVYSSVIDNTANYNKARTVMTKMASVQQAKLDLKEPLDILKETIPLKSFGNEKRIYYHVGRYKLQSNLCHGKLVLNAKTGDVLESSSDATKSMTAYFWKGILLKSSHDWTTLSGAMESKDGSLYLSLTGDHYNFAKILSSFARYAVYNLTEERKQLDAVASRKWYKGGTYSDGDAITPLFSDRNYHYKTGDLVKVTGPANEQFFLGAPIPKPETDDVPFTLETPTWDDDVLKIADSMDATLTNVLQAEHHFGEYGMRALEFYITDVITKLLNQEATLGLVTTLLHELIEESVVKGKSIRSLLSPELAAIEFYVYDAMNEEENSGTNLNKLIDSYNPIIDAEFEMCSAPNPKLKITTEIDEEIERDLKKNFLEGIMMTSQII